MSRLRELFRAARELYLDCGRERQLAEASVESAAADPYIGHTCEPRVMAAREREETMRDASLAMVRHLNPPDVAA